MSENSSINHTVTLKKEDFDYICRCCLSRNPIANIFQLKFHETFLVDIFKLFNTQVNWNDDLPKTICAHCTAIVINFYKFKKMYDKSVGTLENIARDSKEPVKKKGLLLISYEKLNTLPSLGEAAENANIELQNHQVLPLKEDVKNANTELQIHKPLDEDVTIVNIKVEGIKKELNEEPQNNQANLNDNDKNAPTIPKETQKSDQTISSPKKDKHNFTLPYFCKTCNKWIIATGTRHKHSTSRKGSHVCEICGKSYLQKAALKIHYRIHKLILLAKGESDLITDDSTKPKKKYSFHCSCDETFNSSQDLVQHKKEKNHQDPLYKDCKICNKAIRFRGYKKHMRSAHSVTSHKKSFACEYCGLTFTFNANLKRHIMIHTGEKPHVCEFCGKGFIQKTALIHHRRGVHTGERPFVCDFCGKGFILKQQLMDHSRKWHTGEKPYLCDHCGIAFHSSVVYNKHLNRKHSVNKTASVKKMEVQCEICNKSFSSKNCLKQHMVRHDGEKKYNCTHCMKCFYTKMELDSHLITHSDEKKFLCSSCGKAFKKMLSLKVHESIHTEKRPYTCKICFKTFRQSAHLVSHMRIHTGEKPYSCPYCDKSFAHITTRVVHVRSHTGERPYVCDVCYKGFYHSSSMTKHRQTHFKSNIGIKMLTFI